MIVFILAGGALWAQTGDFQSTLFPILEKANCRACHNADGVASATRLHFPDADADADKIAAFGNSLVVLVDRRNPEESLLLRKPTARMPHTGGERIKQNSLEEAVLKAWIAKLAQLSAAELATALKYRELESEGGGPSQDAHLRRLTHSQYDHTVRDLLGDRLRERDDGGVVAQSLERGETRHRLPTLAQQKVTQSRTRAVASGTER